LQKGYGCAIISISINRNVEKLCRKEFEMNEFRKCPTCGYERGFHISFSKDGEHYKIILICPECGDSFDLGLIEERLKSLNPKKENS